MPANDLSKILLIDDSEDIQQIAHVALVEIGGFSLEVGSSGVEGLAKAASFNPQLILLDVIMPDMNGIETYHKLKATAPLAGIPVVFLTAKAEAEDAREYLKLGALGVITKPFDPTTLSECLLEMWTQAGIKQQ